MLRKRSRLVVEVDVDVEDLTLDRFAIDRHEEMLRAAERSLPLRRGARPHSAAKRGRLEGALREFYDSFHTRVRELFIAEVHHPGLPRG